MKTDKKHIVKALIYIVLSFIMYLKIPNTNMSISQFLLPEIYIDEIRRINISGILIIIPMILAYRHIIKSNICKSRTVIVLLMIVMIPYVFNLSSNIKIPYYKFQKGLKAIEVLDEGYCFDYAYYKICDIHFYLELHNYSDDEQEFDIAVILPDELVRKGMPREILLPDKFTIKRNSKYKINKRYEIDYLNKFEEKEIESVYYDFIDYKIRLFNDKESNIITLNK